MTGGGFDTPVTRAVFHVRRDALTKGGGDVVQARAYAAELERHNVTVVIAPFGPAIDTCGKSAHHIFNIDQPFEALEVASRLGKDTPVFVSPIHHSDVAVRRMRRASTASRSDRLLSFLPHAARPLMAFSATTVKSDDQTWKSKASTILRAAGRALNLRARVADLLEESHLFLLSETELRSIQTDYGCNPRRYTITPNGYTAAAPIESRRALKEARVIVAGRIEPRKRQLEVLRAAEELGLPVTFVGEINANSPRYASAFEEAIGNSQAGSTWLGPLPHAELTDLMARSRVLVNASWAEVQSLVDLEAAANGCWVLTTEDGGASQEWLGAQVIVYAPHRLRDLLVKAAELRTSPDLPPLSTYAHTWASTVNLIATAYRPG